MSHIPVMCEEVLNLFRDQKSPLLFLDATFGRGGHSRALLENLKDSKVIALDRDPDAVAYGKAHMDFGDRLEIRQERFSHIGLLFSQPIFSGILFDLGISSPQVDEAERGFSFLQEGPLDMRMDQKGVSAAELVQKLSERDLADLFFRYGEERASRRIAKAIVKARANTPITQTHELSQIIKEVMPAWSKRHPATKVFQALRIAVNNEIQELEEALPSAEKALKPGGCLVAIAFHSLEDRIVKSFFKNSSSLKAGSKKPLCPREEEVSFNPRARSARLRFGVREI